MMVALHTEIRGLARYFGAGGTTLHLMEVNEDLSFWTHSGLMGDSITYRLYNQDTNAATIRLYIINQVVMEIILKQ